MSYSSLVTIVLSSPSGSPRDTMSLDVAGGAAINGGNADDNVNNGSSPSPKDDRCGAQPAYAGHNSGGDGSSPRYKDDNCGAQPAYAGHHAGSDADGSDDGAYAQPPTPPRLRAARERRDRLVAGAFYGPPAGTNPAASHGHWQNKDDRRLPQQANAAAAGSSSRSKPNLEPLPLDKDSKDTSAATATTKTTRGGTPRSPTSSSRGRRHSRPPSPDSRPPSPGAEGEENVIRASSALARMANSTPPASPPTTGSSRRGGSLLSAVGLGRAPTLAPRSSVSVASRHLVVPSAPLSERLSSQSSSSTLVGSSRSPSPKLAALASPINMGPRALERRDSWDSSGGESDSDDGSLYYVFNDNPWRTPLWVPVASVPVQREPPAANLGTVDLDERIRQINAEMDAVDQSRTPLDTPNLYDVEIDSPAAAAGAGAGPAPGASEKSSPETSRPGLYKGKAKRTTADSLASLAREEATGGPSVKRSGSIASMSSAILELPQVQQALFDGCRPNANLGDLSSKFELVNTVPDSSPVPAAATAQTSAGPSNAMSVADYWLGSSSLQSHFPSLCARFKAQAMKSKKIQAQSQAPADAQAQQQASSHVSATNSPALPPSNVPAVQGTSGSPPPPINLPATEQPAGDVDETEVVTGLGSGDTGSDVGGNDADMVEPDTDPALDAEAATSDAAETATSEVVSESMGASGEVDASEGPAQVADVANSKNGGSMSTREAWYARNRRERDNDKDGAIEGDSEASTQTVADPQGPSDLSPGAGSVADKTKDNDGAFDWRLSQAFSAAPVAKDPMVQLESAHVRHLYLCRAIAHAEALLHKGRDAFSKACVPLSVSRKISARYAAYVGNIADLKGRAEEWRKASEMFERKIPFHRRFRLRATKQKAAKLAAAIPEAVVASMAGPLWSDESGRPTFIFGRYSTVFRARVCDKASDVVDMIVGEVLEGEEWVPMAAFDLGDWLAWD